ncbi:hypothetical protein BH11BAC1_BH11BAC1_19880 [soil metagenome]
MSRRKNILVLTYWSYKEALIQAYTLPYVYIIREQLGRGSKIYLVTFEQKHLKLTADERSQVKERLRLKGIRLITLKYKKMSFLSFFYWFFMGFYLWGLVIFNRINFIHAWCTTAGSIGYMLSKLTGKKLIIDSYEPHAEAMVENKIWQPNSIPFKLLFYFEKKLSHRAQIIISATAKMREYAKEKYNVTFDYFYAKPACVDLKLFSDEVRKDPELVRQFKFEDKIVCVYAGKFGGIYLTTEVFDFFKSCQEYWGNKFRVLLLTPHNKEEIYMWCKRSGFDAEKLAIKFITHEDMPLYMGLGDFAITPVKPIPTKRYCTPIKDGEYWALGLPIVITKNISDDSDIIEQAGIGTVLENFRKEDYSKAVQEIDALLQNQDINRLHRKIRDVASANRNYSIARKVYEQVYLNDLR